MANKQKNEKKTTVQYTLSGQLDCANMEEGVYLIVKEDGTEVELQKYLNEFDGCEVKFVLEQTELEDI